MTEGPQLKFVQRCLTCGEDIYDEDVEAVCLHHGAPVWLDHQDSRGLTCRSRAAQRAVVWCAGASGSLYPVLAGDACGCVIVSDVDAERSVEGAEHE